MSAPLLTTKYRQPPALPERVSRPRLTARLDDVLSPGRRLALVSAPAGSGKTTLVRAWIEQIAASRSSKVDNLLRTAWFSMDEADNDLTAFLAYLSAALQAVCPDSGPEPFVAPAVDASGRLVPMPAMLTPLINRLADLSGLTVLVLDDYHWISAPAVHECLAFLLEHLPESTRLVIVTRADSLLPLSRLRARGQLVEVREADLRFDSTEAALFLNEQMGLKLDPSHVELLTQHTEGWATGLQMAALALRALPDSAEKSAEFIRNFSGSHRFVLDYLMDEVFSHLPPDTQSFLLNTAVLDRFCAEVCAVVCGEPAIEAVNERLRSLSQANLFTIPLDEERRWFRYHHLFVELLRNRLRQMASPEKIAELQRRASAWFAAEGLNEEAIQYALLAGEFKQAAGLVEACVQDVMSAGRQATVQRWLAALPGAIIFERPRLRIFQAWTHYLEGDSAAAIGVLDETRNSLEQLAQSDDTQTLMHELLSILALSNLSGGESSRVIEMAQDALKHIPETEPNIRARLLFAQGMACGVIGDRRFFPLLDQALDLARRVENYYLAANILFNQAFAAETFMLQLRSAWQLYQKIVDLCAAAGPGRGSPAGVGLIGQAGIALEWNELDTAARLLERGQALCREGGITTVDFYAFLARARLAQARGDWAGAAAALDDAGRNGSIISQQMTAVLLIQSRVRLCLASGHVEAAARWARGEEWPVGPGMPAALQEISDLSQAQVSLAQGQPEATLALLETLVPQAEAARRMTHVLEASLLQALARHAVHEGALEPLEHALSLGEPEAVTRHFLEAGPLLRRLLVAYRARLGKLTTEADRLLSYLVEPAPSAPAAKTPPSASELIEPLTPRELDVLRLLYAGKSNQEIASALYLSLSAVKKHTGNIYGKLGVASRAQAIARCRELKLV